MESERLARLEGKIDVMNEYLRDHMEEQDKHNEIFYRNRDKVERMEAKHGVISALAVFMSGLISIIAGFFTHK